MTFEIAAGPVAPRSPELARLLERIAVGAAAREREEIAPFEQIAWLREAGIGRLRLPRDQGGAGATLPELFEVLIDLSSADSNVAHILRVHFAFVEQQLTNADPDARQMWIEQIAEDKLFGNAASEQNAGTVGAARGKPGIETTLIPDGVGFRLTGTKYYSTGTMYCDYTVVDAVTPEGAIAYATIPVDRAGVTIEDDWDGFGQRLTGTGTVRLDDVQVLADEIGVYGAPGAEWAPSYQGAFLQLYLQAVTAGILASVRDDSVALVRRRVRNFSHAATPLPKDDPQVLQVVGEIAADAFAARATVLAAAQALEQVADSVVDDVPDPGCLVRAQIAAASAKVAVDRFSYATAARLFDAGGASATQAPHNLDRHWRNVRTISTHNPTFLKASAIGDYHVNTTPPPNNGYF